MTTLTHEHLLSVLRFKPDTGKFYWKVKVRSNIRPGDEAGASGQHGYSRIMIGGRDYYVHRLAWFYMTGHWPDQVDHINLDRRDNRWCNLREATRDQNNVNKGARRSSTTGLKGVLPRRSKGCFEARIKINGKFKYLGSFKTPEEANAAYAEAAREIHGEFARW